MMKTRLSFICYHGNSQSNRCCAVSLTVFQYTVVTSPAVTHAQHSCHISQGGVAVHSTWREWKSIIKQPFLVAALRVALVCLSVPSLRFYGNRKVADTSKFSG